jgi:pimeloyl-ACP methyl ester carboxylesterase
MPYANNQGVRIHYEVEENGPPLVLVHGGLGSLERWHQFGFVELLKNDYELILVDARGHGDSDKPHDPEAYRLALMVADVVAVLDDLHVTKAHYLGYSLGAFIGLGIGKYALERFHTLILGGPGVPVNRVPERPQFVLEAWKCREGMEAHLAAMEAIAGKWWTPEVQATLRSNDLEAIIALLVADEGILLSDFEDVLPNVTVPCLIYVGEHDPEEYLQATEFAKRIANATFVSFPGLDHLDALCRSDLVVPHVKKSLAEVGEG